MISGETIAAIATSIADAAVIAISVGDQTRNIYGVKGVATVTAHYSDRSKVATALPTIASIPLIPAIARVPSQAKVPAATKQALKNPALQSKMNRDLQDVKAGLDFGKLIDLLNLAFSFHNAAMLSTDLVRSCGQVIDNVLNLFGLNTDGEASVANLVSNQFAALANAVLGAKTVADIKTKFARLSAIYTAGTNLLSTVQSMHASTMSVIEVTGSYIGKIGNALKKAGGVSENAYNWMSEGLTARTARLTKLTESLESAQQIQPFRL